MISLKLFDVRAAFAFPAVYCREWVAGDYSFVLSDSVVLPLDPRWG